ncbi:YybH family protein [Flavobacterium marginilacus]|uniref:YybH family protein n=1 Tax=Flavobacterium marginilacus TaxID=3003256 RepID=UPI00248D6076|nr:hypothetical protein [Flavobacterium marginilacus]
MNKALNQELVAIEATAVTYLTAFTRGDVAVVLSAFADDGVLIAPNLPAAVGKTELAKIYPLVLEAVDFNMNYMIREVEQISADWGFVRSSTEGKETNKQTGTVTHTAYNELFLLRKSLSGVWQIARYATSMVSSNS